MKKNCLKNIDIVLNKYSKVIGILYNGKEVKVYKNKELLEEVSEKLEPKRIIWRYLPKKS